MDDLTQIIQDHAVRIFSEGETVYDIISDIISDSNIEDKPIFIVDIGVVARMYERFAELLPGVQVGAALYTPSWRLTRAWQVYYAAKCNSDPVILKVLAAKGSRFDVASYGEISTVLEFTKPENLLLAHPIKPCDTLKYARAVDVDMMTFDSENELLKIKLYHPAARLLLRLQVDDTGSTSRFSCKFGVTPETIKSMLALARTLGLDVAGASFHVGSGCSNPALYGTAVRQALDTLTLAKEFGMNATIVDIGGGFSSDTFEAAADVIRPLVEAHPDVTWIAEPGRLLVNDSSTLVVSVVGKKELPGPSYTFYVNDSVYSSFNGIIFDRRKVQLQPFNEREGLTFKSKVYGNTCDGIDEICAECMLPNLAIGERVFVSRMGAYSSASACLNFNGFFKPETVYVLTTH
jgi:ornithine decarboxylase